MNDSTIRANFFGRALRHHWKLAATVFFIGLMVAAGFVATAKPTYSSTSIVFLDPLAGNPFSPATPASRTEQLAALTTEAGLVYTDAVVQSAVAIAKATGAAVGPEMRGDILTVVPSNTTVVQITYTQPTPKLAQAGAQALAEAYLGYRKDRATKVVAAQAELRTQQKQSITDLLTDASTRLNTAKTTASDQAQVLDLQQQVTLYATQLATVNVDQTGADATSISPGDIISPAILPTGSDGVNPLLVALAIILVAAAFGLLIAFARENVDQRIREPEDVLAAGIRPVKGTLRRWRKRDSTVADMEGLRRIANVLAASEPVNRNVLYLAGAPAGTDTLNVATGMANVFHELGTRVVIIAATIDSPAKFDAKAPGLTDLLFGDIPLDGAWDLLNVTSTHSLLPLGTKPELLAKLVQGPKLTNLLQKLREKAPVIIAGPALDSGAGVAIARHAGEVLLIVDGHSAKVSDLEESQELLGQIQIGLSGAVLIQRASRRRRRTTHQDHEFWTGTGFTPGNHDRAPEASDNEVRRVSVPVSSEPHG